MAGLLSDEEFLSLKPGAPSGGAPALMTDDEFFAAGAGPEKQPASAADGMTEFLTEELALGTQPGSFAQELGNLVGTGARFADAAVRQLAEGITLGGADELAGVMSGAGADAERAKTESGAELLGPVASTGLRIAGSVAPVSAVARGVGAAGRIARVLPVIGRVAASPTVQATVTGALTGVGGALGHDRDIGTEAAIGAAGGLGGHILGNAIASGVGRVAGLFNRRPAIPTRDAIDAARRAAYDAADQAGVMFTPRATDRLSQNITTALTDMGYDPALHPGAAAVVRRLADLQGQNVTLTGLDTLRKVASNGYVPGNRSNNLAVGRIIDAIDDVIARPTSGEVLAGNSAAGASALRRARGLAARAAKLDTVDDAVNRADLRAASTGSGGNVDNATRQNLRRLLERPRGFSGDEREALETVVRGTPTQNALRLVGKMAPTGIVSGGIGSAMGASMGSAIGGPGGAAVGSFAVPAIGQAAKTTADRMTMRNVDALRDIIAAGGSRAATQPTPNALHSLAEAERDFLARILSGSGAVLAPQYLASGK